MRDDVPSTMDDGHGAIVGLYICHPAAGLAWDMIRRILPVAQCPHGVQRAQGNCI